MSKKKNELAQELMNSFYRVAPALTEAGAAFKKELDLLSKKHNRKESGLDLIVAGLKEHDLDTEDNMERILHKILSECPEVRMGLISERELLANIGVSVVRLLDEL